MIQTHLTHAQVQIWFHLYSDWKDESSTSGGHGGGYKDEKDDIPTGGNTWDWDEG